MLTLAIIFLEYFFFHLKLKAFFDVVKNMELFSRATSFSPFNILYFVSPLFLNIIPVSHGIKDKRSKNPFF